MGTLYLDLDGVLADFDAGAYQALGECHYRYEFMHGADALWSRLNAVPDFFANFPMANLAGFLWGLVKHLRPVVLTALPKTNGEEVDRQKRKWVSENLGTDVQVITCLTHQKPNFCKPRDILVDDRTLNRDRWEKRGGFYVHHTDVGSTISELKRLEVL